MTGFTYNGIHCSEFGLYYIPSKEDLWFPDPDYDVYSEDVGWRNGGYYYGTKVKIRKMTLRCYFEEISVATRQAIKQWLHRNSYGKLIFDDMPFVYWNVRPSKIADENWYNDNNDTHSGTFNITFSAYDPFGYLTRKSNNGTENDNANDYCNLISTSSMPSAPGTDASWFDIYNPGTEECGLSFEITGSTTKPIRFFNETNGTYFAFNSLPTDLRFGVDGETGYVYTRIADSNVYDNGYAYHDEGYIKLIPNYTKQNVPYTYGGMNGTLHTFTLSGLAVNAGMVGAKLVANNKTFRVKSISLATNSLYCNYSTTVTVPDTGTCNLFAVNHIDIQQKNAGGWSSTNTALTLSYINVDYKPRVL